MPALKMSIVVVAHNMARELPRTLSSLSAGYQRNIDPDTFEVIVVDSGSIIPVSPDLLSAHKLTGRVVRLPAPPFTLARAVNLGLRTASGSIVGVLLDGGRLLSPGVLAAACDLLSANPARLVAPLGWDIGFDLQRHSVTAGFTAGEEDRLLAAIEWPTDGYRLFDISVFDADTPAGWPGPLLATSFPFLSRSNWERIGGADEAFDERAGGYLARDIQHRALAIPGLELVVLATEGTFHQNHGGIHSSSDDETAASFASRWSAQYERLRGVLPRPVDASRASTWTGPARSPQTVALPRKQATVPRPVLGQLLDLARSEFGAGSRESALAVARLARRLATEDIDVLRQLRSLAMSPATQEHPEAVTLALGRARLITGEKEAAEQLFRAATAADPHFVDAHVALSRLRFPGPDYLAILDRIHAILRPAIYLEVGIAWGASIARARPPTIAIGVDPVPNPHCQLVAQTHIFSETSDAFFASSRLQSITGGAPPNLAFIDGLHLFEQVLRDFINVERICSPSSIILLHDTAPLDERTQSRSVDTPFHTGDVWKILPCLRRYRPDLQFLTLPAAPTGLTIVRNLDPTSTVLADRYDEAVAAFIDYPYEEFALDMANAINLQPIDVADLLLARQ